MIDAAEAIRSKAQFFWIAPGKSNKFGDRLHGQCRAHYQQERRLGHEHDGYEIVDGIIGNLSIHTGVGPMRAASSKEERVTVRRSSCHGGGTKHAAGATLIFDNDGLSNRLAELGRENPCDEINTASGGEWNHNFDYLIGVILGPSR